MVSTLHGKKIVVGILLFVRLWGKFKRICVQGSIVMNYNRFA